MKFIKSSNHRVLERSAAEAVAYKSAAVPAPHAGVLGDRLSKNLDSGIWNGPKHGKPYHYQFSQSFARYGLGENRKLHDCMFCLTSQIQHVLLFRKKGQHVVEVQNGSL
jgi:hypothetical protein